MNIRLLAVESTLNTTPDNFSGAKRVRVLNDTAGSVLVTLKRDDAIRGTMTLAAGSSFPFEKLPNETLEASAAIKAVPIAYTV